MKSLKKWVGLSRKEQLAFKVSAALEKEIESYYFGLYANRWLPDTRRDWGTPSRILMQLMRWRESLQ
ncbi:hypothetical protein [Pseudomonas sp. TH10]|uniref:hypothetical protein n=1 Tax=Pseudomonas sp. TH10 TaxID=2796376 RepID=UPI0027DD428C|nr:hypothetical protein [Pseudomonas sp. TH10]